jgi:hypothetical protein
MHVLQHNQCMNNECYQCMYFSTTNACIPTDRQKATRKLTRSKICQLKALIQNVEVQQKEQKALPKVIVMLSLIKTCARKTTQQNPITTTSSTRPEPGQRRCAEKKKQIGKVQTISNDCIARSGLGCISCNKVISKTDRQLFGPAVVYGTTKTANDNIERFRIVRYIGIVFGPAQPSFHRESMRVLRDAWN